eukprot:CAMPEP_0119467902 /NCGR_PEP_ID=MMETSP1344-20130328/1886_1 /TAXON_ID=236787 /ORGANISM="Florenciella parvula, Strain CCMP2471" /LENGTH=205 /DNA_ID=CAMNT_0007500317 /DNA_START=68 /DNA_END=682 /DNA_ORIENTATION=+
MSALSTPSFMEKSSMSSAVDTSGKLNTTMIQKELADSLKEDRNYHNTDEAKKKYITKCATYDEFRHMVASADQKRVSRAEMETLGKTTKGWEQKTKLTTGAKKSARAKRQQTKGSKKLSQEFPTTPPATSMQFERDWRRHCKELGAQLRYLRLCGSETVLAVFKTEIDAALLGKLLAALAGRAAELRAGGATEGGRDWAAAEVRA